MAKTLLVNCSLKGTTSKALVEAVGKFSEYVVVPFNRIYEGYQIGEDIDVVVISGSAARIVDPVDSAKFEGIVELIGVCNLPIFGICFGHQLLCRTLGAEVGALSNSIDNCFQKIRIVKVDDIFVGFSGGQTIPLAEYHSDYVLKKSLDKASLTLLADSPSCEVEAVKHKTKPFYGVQFHPERATIRNITHFEGHTVIENFYSRVVRR
jgi:GMP synthase-like glutamine amidotransferase